MQQFDKDCELKPESGKHSISGISEDINHIVSVLLDQKVFHLTPGRFYPGFQNLLKKLFSGPTL
jgi:hypothetical protein